MERRLPTNENRLLAALPAVVYEQLIPRLRSVHLQAGSILDAPDSTWFITTALTSLFPYNKDGHIIEAAMVGCDGAVSLPSISRTNGTSLCAQVQITGAALQIATDDLRAIVLRSRELLTLLHDYNKLLAEQVAQSLICYRSHRREQRLARWLLMARDRTASDELGITHENIALALGVSRGKISAAARRLQKQELIQYMRGRINIMNRSGLEDAACDCYQIIHLMTHYFFSPDVMFPGD